MALNLMEFWTAIKFRGSSIAAKPDTADAYWFLASTQISYTVNKDLPSWKNFAIPT